MIAFRKGRYAARLADGPMDVRAAQALRWQTFIAGRGADLSGARADGLDTDPFDDICAHVLIEEAATGELVCCFRLLPLAGGSEIGRSYAAQYYDLEALTSFEGPMVEMGRFCIRPDHQRDPDILRVAWAAMTGFVDRDGVELLFGCSSFEGTEADTYADAFAYLKEKHLAPRRWLPRVKAPSVFRFGSVLKLKKPNLKLAMTRMPPLLRSYLVLGGWVSDHAVVDRDLNTLHVFTGLEIKRVPAGRARLLRGMVG